MKTKSKSFFHVAREQHRHARSLNKMQWMNLGLFVAVVMVGVGYVASVNSASTLGYEIRGLEKEIASLRVMNEQVEYQVAELQSVDNVTNKVQMLGMVPVDGTTYLTTAGATVAVNR